MEHHEEQYNIMDTGVPCDKQFVFYNYTTFIDQNDENYSESDRTIPNEIHTQHSSNNVQTKGDGIDLIINNLKNSQDGSTNRDTHYVQETERKKHKGVRHEENWKRNRIKMMRNSGQSYVNWRNKEVAPRTLKPPCGERCRLKCKRMFTEVQREQIFSNYWALGNVDRQRDFIACFVKFLKKKHQKPSVMNSNNLSSCRENTRQSRRQMTYIYTLPQSDESVKVCKAFFLNTLSISHQVVKTVAAKYSKSGHNAFLTDQRGKQCREKYSDNVKNIVRKHIMKFVVIEDTQTKSSCDDGKDRVRTKRIRQEENWKRNKIKCMRNNGKSYINWRNKPVAERSLKPPCGEQCKLQCSINFSENQRLQIFNDYWELGDVNRQRFFIVRFVNFVKTKSQKLVANQIISQSDNSSRNNESRRLFTYIYTFPRDGQIVRVCKIFFLNTLCISHQVVKTVASKCKNSSTGSRIITDQRGKRNLIQQQQQIKKASENKVKRHVTKNYIPASMTITKMYTMYKKNCEDNNISTVVTPYIYKKIFTQQLNSNKFIIKNTSLDDHTTYKDDKDVQLSTSSDLISSSKYFESRCLGQNYAMTSDQKIVDEFEHVVSTNVNVCTQNVYVDSACVNSDHNGIKEVNDQHNIYQCRQEGCWTPQYISY